ncbi:MAG: hypothetical protein GY744_12960 [Gammaproteobacteria bacterium]|nr:hypothetical protein [Gammaproteobacteria bacterium]
MNTNSSTSALPSVSLQSYYQQLSKSRKFVIFVFLVWLIQAIPKWSVAITADGELSAEIMKIFITPRVDTQFAKPENTDQRENMF